MSRRAEGNSRTRRTRTSSVLSFARVKDGSGRYMTQSIRSSSELKAKIEKQNSKARLQGISLDESIHSSRSNIPFNKPIEEIYYGVHDGKVLGYGVSGYIRRITNKDTGEHFAIKALDMKHIENDEDKYQLMEEIDIMCQLDHPNIVLLEEIYESDEIIYLVQELCKGGELFDRLDEQPDFHYSEEKAAVIVKQILSAVAYLHSQGIVHRDLKLENFLLSSKEPDATIKMIDFGLSKHFKYSDKHHDRVGTPYTVAPEVINGEYDEKCDVWGIGVIAYLLLCGESPFGGCDSTGVESPLHVIRNNILSGSFKFAPEDVWKDVSQEAKDFITQLLTVDPNERPSCRQVRNLPWLLMHAYTEEEKDDDKEADDCLCLQNPLLAKFVSIFGRNKDS